MFRACFQGFVFVKLNADGKTKLVIIKDYTSSELAKAARGK